MKLIITGCTGFVGEGVLLTALERSEVEHALSIGRRPCGITHPKLEEYILPDLMQIQAGDERLNGYDAVLFCAGMTGGFPHDKFKTICHDIPLHLAEVLPNRNEMSYIFVAGEGAGKVKRETEQKLFAMDFMASYSFRMGIMKPMEAQKNSPKTIKMSNRWYKVAKFFHFANTMENIGLSMIECVKNGYDKKLIGIKDIDILADRLMK